MGFYKRFGRPIAKVFFGAVFTYQVAYLVWNKLETDVVMDQKRSIGLPYRFQKGGSCLIYLTIEEILKMEAQIKAYKEARKL